MESEKVKEIKSVLNTWKIVFHGITNKDILTLINDLESENETLRNAKVVYETVDYCAEDLRKAQERIAELESENKKYKRKLTTNQWVQEIRKEVLNSFAERLKEKCEYNRKEYFCVATVSANDIDETLKEFINE